CFFGVSTAETAVAQSRETGVIKGVIQLGGGSDGLGVVQVRLESSGRLIREQPSGNRQFEFANVPPGSYTVLVTASGFDDAATRVSVPVEEPVVVTMHRKADINQSPLKTISAYEYQIPKSARKEFTIAQDAAHKNDCTGAIQHIQSALAIFEQYAA